MKLHKWIPALALLLAVAACDDKEQLPAAAIVPSAESASLFTDGIKVPASASEVTVKFTSARSWTLILEDSRASWIAVTPTYGNAGEAIVTVSIQKNPELESRSTAFTFTSEEVSKTVRVTQAAREIVPISSVSLDFYEVSLYAGETATLMATVFPSNTDQDKTVTWTSSNERVATVNGGVITAVYEGEATVTAKAGDKEAACKVTVLHTVIEVEGITLDRTEASAYVGDSFKLTATVTPANADDTTVTWTSSNPAVASVEGGLVKALAEGSAKITAKAGGKTATCDVVVLDQTSQGGDMDIDPTDPDLWN